jgi:hypothetical protein
MMRNHFSFRSPLSLAQHPDQHRSQGSVLLPVDQEFSEGAALRVAPELADPIGSLEVGQHEDVEQLCAGSRPERGEDLARCTDDGSF